MKPFAVTLCASLLLTGCAIEKKYQPIQPQVKHHAVVYLYRPEVQQGRPQPLKHQAPVVLLNGEPQGLLSNQRYKAFELKPGQYELKLSGEQGDDWDKPDLVRTFSVRHGEQKYLKFRVLFDPESLGIFTKPRHLLLLTPIAADQAQSEIEGLSLQR